MKTTFWKITKYFFWFVLLVILYILINLVYGWYSNLDPQGGSSSACVMERLPSVANNSGMVVTAQNTACSGFGGNSAIYVHLHKSDEDENSGNLVFRYFDEPGDYPLNIQWTSNASVRISVGHVSEITKQLSAMKGVNIDYAIGKEDYPKRILERKPILSLLFGSDDPAKP